MNFATLKGLTIPEGVVTQIADASGNVLWSAVKKVTITIEGNGGDYAHVVIDGVTYNTATTVEVPIGTVISCVAKGINARTIRCNYAKVGSGYDELNGDAQYEYTVVSDATIDLKWTNAIIGSNDSYYDYGIVDIVDANAPDGAAVTIIKTGVASAPGSGAVIIDGVRYTNPMYIVIPFGTVIVCSASWSSHQMYGSYGGQIKLNGTLVADRVSDVNPTTYEYTVNKDVQIDLNNVVSPNGVVTNINITEL